MGPKSLFRLFATIAVCLYAAAVTAEEPAPAEGIDDPVIAFNLSDVTDWGNNMPLLDVARTMRPIFAGGDGAWEAVSHDDLMAGGYLDTNGWPKRLPKGATTFRTGFDWSDKSPAAPSRAGRYVLTYRGTGRIELGGSAELVEEEPGRIVFDDAAGTGFWLDIPQTDPEGTGDYIRDISIVREDRLALFQAGAVFNPDWIAVIKDAREIRFMDWMSTNGSDIEHWDQRPRVEDASWAAKGVPLEIMVRLANEIGAEPWFTLPHKADDAYVRDFATYVRDNLDPRLKVRVEFSNEVWNGGFDQFYWVDQQGRDLWHQDAGIYYHAKRATEMALICQDVFAGEAAARLVNVLGGWTVNSWLTEELLTAKLWKDMEPDAYVRPADVFEEVAVTTYFGNEVIGNPDVREILRAKMKLSDAEAASWLTARMKNPDAKDSIPQTLAYLAKQRAVTDRYGLRLSLYEGGQHVHHLYAVDDLSEDEVARLTAFAEQYVRGPDMADLYQMLWDGWRKVGQGPFMQYTDVDGASKWGSWGLYDHLGDSTPRSELLARLAAGGGSWWGEGGGPQFRQGVIRDATAGEALVGTPEEDYLIGGDGDDLLVPGAGADGLNGGAGEDTVQLAGGPGDYRASAEGDGVRLSGPDGDKYLLSIERAAFADGQVLPIGDLIRE